MRYACAKRFCSFARRKNPIAALRVKAMATFSILDF
jgi:hypothetical protein